MLLQAGERDRRGTVFIRVVDYDGGWTEYAMASQETVVPIPDELPFEQACIIPDAVSTPSAAVTDTGRTRPGEAVAFNYLQQAVLGHYGSEAEHVEQLVSLARQRRLDLSASVSDVLPLAEAEQAVRRVQTKQGNPIRLILRP